MQNKKTAAHTLQAAAIQCKNPAATQCRGKKQQYRTARSSRTRHCVSRISLCSHKVLVFHARKQEPCLEWLWDGLESSQNKTYCVHSKSPMILLPTSLAQVLITFLPILETRRRNLQGQLKIASFRWNVRIKSRSKRHPQCGTK